MDEGKDVGLPGLWDGLFPDNLERELCAGYVRPVSVEHAASYIPSGARTLALLWEASRLKAELAHRNPHYARFTDQGWINMADESFGQLPENIERELNSRLQGMHDVLSQTIPEDERWSWEAIETGYPALPAETVGLIIRFLDARPVETVHYVGNVDAPLCKALVAGRYKLSIMDMLNKHESGHGYRFDTHLNLTCFDRPPWLKGLAFYEEGAPQLPDVWIRDCRWDWPGQLEELMTGRRRRQRMPYLVLLGNATEHGRHRFFQWSEAGGVHFGELLEQYRPDLSDEERTEMKRSDRRMRGEGQE